MKTGDIHPSKNWIKSANKRTQDSQTRLRLAAMAGHMQQDKVAARRAALVDLLADGRPHPREEIWQTISVQLGGNCWGKIPQEALARDLAALRQGGIRIAYCRRPKITGYYLQYPALKRPLSPRYDATNWHLIHHLDQLSPAEKNLRAFAAADFALRQKIQILTEANPAWTAEQVEKRARQIVFGRLEY